MASKSGERALNARQTAFCLEYLKDLNATQAAIRAGYSKRTAASIGFENLRKPEIAERIAELVEERNEKVKVDAQWVLQRLLRLELTDLRDLFGEDGSLKDPKDLSEELSRLVAGIDVVENYQGSGANRKLVGYTKKIRLIDRVKVTELIGKLVDVAAFRENVHHDGATTLILRDYTGVGSPHRARKISASEPHVEALPGLPEETIDTEAVASVAEEPEKSEEQRLDELEAHLEQEMKPEPETWSIARPWETERQTEALTDD